MCFDTTNLVPSAKNGWDVADFLATVPSALHDPAVTLADPGTYVIYGVPDPSFIGGGHTAYEAVPMRGKLFMKQATQGPQPITYAWGALCPNTDKGGDLLGAIVRTLGEKYFQL